MRPSLLAPMVLVLSSSASLPAFAQEAKCSENEWFCSTNDTVSVETESTDAATTVDVQPEVAPSKAPPVVIIIVQPGATVAPPPPRPGRPAPTPQRRPVVRQVPSKKPAATPKTPDGWKSTAGFEFRIQRFGYMLDSVRGNAAKEASMLGGGAGVRIPFRRNLELDIQNEFFVGTDFNGFERSEVGLSTHLVRYLNPTSRARFYSIAGGYLALANVHSEKPHALLPLLADDGCHYASAGIFGAQAGFGAEIRLSPFFSLRSDAQLAMRWRFAGTQDAPEYIDARTGREANTYPGFLLRAGVTIW